MAQRTQLKPEILNQLKSNYKLRSLIANDLNIHERTVWRWVKDQSGKLTEIGFLNIFNKYSATKVKSITELVETIEVEEVA